MASLKTTIEQLEANWQKLSLHWGKTSLLWSDSVQQDVERDYWVPLEGQMKRTLGEMNRLSHTIAHVQRMVK
jgi:hypothetical protein